MPQRGGNANLGPLDDSSLTDAERAIIAKFIEAEPTRKAVRGLGPEAAGEDRRKHKPPAIPMPRRRYKDREARLEGQRLDLEAAGLKPAWKTRRPRGYNP